MKKIQSLFFKLRQIGLICSIICFTKKIYLSLLAKIYGFDNWHASAPYECRPYKWECVELVRINSPRSVLEVGCGLGDIVARTDGVKHACDIDDQVLLMAKKLNKDVNFFQSSLDHTSKIVKNTSGQDIDLLVMVNWPHLISWDSLKQSITNLKSELKLKYIVLDTIDPNLLNYLHHHSEKDILELGKIIKRIKSKDQVRELFLVELNPSQ